ncbi:MAG: 2-dehydro-3-deoxygalactonokinase [Cyclobacterium sp.]|uniref:2-dehydro-3-deoxygalactonokinase n=1 Tax=unclassified Cyclobacterium TaxID=2615055 RepID=UPI0013D7B695|nr:2-dehydro-3-deoxygalactonokinase [Cyclobacterium sp. SYSU L10401]
MKQFLSCDWGTSSFRLRLVNRIDAEILGEYTSADGVQVINKAYLQEAPSLERSTYYFQFLSQCIKAFSRQLHLDLEGLLVVCSGMASSTIGLKPLPYARLPFDIDGKTMNTHFFEPSASLGHPFLLLSGIRAAMDVMRGEETQLLGVIRQMENFNGKGTFIFPGTHSKHLLVSHQKIHDFQTFMTGEVFHLMSHSSILSKSVEIPVKKSTGMEKAFEHGVMDGAENNLLAALFKVRANDLFDKLDKFENLHYLSGLLIGNELSNLAGNMESKVYLCSEEKLYWSYSKALEVMGIPSEVLTPEKVRKAVIYAQIEIINRIEKHEKDIFLGSF